MKRVRGGGWWVERRLDRDHGWKVEGSKVLVRILPIISSESQSVLKRSVYSDRAL